MTRREFVWRLTFAAVACFAYAMALVSAAHGQIGSGLGYAAAFAACCFMALDEPLEDI